MEEFKLYSVSDDYVEWLFQRLYQNLNYMIWKMKQIVHIKILFRR